MVTCDASNLGCSSSLAGLHMQACPTQWSRSCSRDTGGRKDRVERQQSIHAGGRWQRTLTSNKQHRHTQRQCYPGMQILDRQVPQKGFEPLASATYLAKSITPRQQPQPLHIRVPSRTNLEAPHLFDTACTSSQNAQYSPAGQCSTIRQRIASHGCPKHGGSTASE